MTALLRRCSAILRYLGRAGAPWSWRLYRDRCPNCGYQYFLAMGPSAFLTRCLLCRGNVTNLSLIPVIEVFLKEQQVVKAWEMSTYGATLAYLQRSVEKVYFSEFIPPYPSGSTVHGILVQDVQETSFASSSLDLITCNQVFEHVADDLQGFRECFRVLRPGPLCQDTCRTIPVAL